MTLREKILNAWAAGFTAGHIARRLGVQPGLVGRTVWSARRRDDPRAVEKYNEEARAIRAAVGMRMWFARKHHFEGDAFDFEEFDDWHAPDLGVPVPRERAPE